MQETKTEPYNQDIDMEIKEERRKVVDNRRTVMQQLGIREDHPTFCKLRMNWRNYQLIGNFCFTLKLRNSVTFTTMSFANSRKGRVLTKNYLN